MELAVILLFVLSIAVVSTLWGRIEKRRAANPTSEAGTSSGADGSAGARPATARPARPARQAQAGAGTSPQAAKEAASLLTAEQHRQIYAALGQGQPVKALKLYAMFTGSGIRASGAAITNMAAHPQPYVRPAADPGTPAAPDAAKPGLAQPDAAKADAANPGAGAESEAVREEEISKWAQQLRPEDFLKP
ncbi:MULTISPECIES: hypothetical protein [unclassified Arthrobacter]|uniref:hypothetical protein n=1 Tax=unclassified Arthrobacter TaxID=235627 RepID=UPI001E3A64E8|nr:MULTISPECIES: hypothetical protein [unclassified Arthrobacter]MCC9146704.1 hypothetical protein [Arthrobacter sp. zg-Y919]MDK1277935.1 hypothetical protein [Arthrobacter sp. zg.Y919]WIB03471.1 hypothetical protein QNO10_01910 [Arthrobacter sp. zg-Y919]